MSVEIRGTYTGNLGMNVTHGPSGTVIRTAAPVDNMGDGSSFAPTDLVAAAVGACAVTTMAIVARKEGIPFEGAEFVVHKHMRSDPRRIAGVPLTIRMPGGLSPEHRRRLENVARSCPVNRSLLPEIEHEVEFVYPD